MDLKSRVNAVQAKMNGAVAALTYGYMAHMNNAGANIIDIGTDTNAVNSTNIENSACSSEILRGLVHAFQDSYKGVLAADSTVCDPKYISWNCVMKDKNGITQRGAAADLFIDYPYATKCKNEFNDRWTESTISDTSRKWYSVCYGNGMFVAIAFDSNYFAYSTDGINWTETNSGLTVRPWRSVCYGNGKFIAVASGTNYFAYSTDGITWTESTISDTSRNWYSVCYGKDKFVVVTYNSNYFAYSTNGINWTEGTISSTNRDWRSICYGNNKYVAIAYNSNYFAYSTNGINWTEGTNSSTSRSLYSACYGNGMFVAVAINSNYFAYSTDGINWTEDTISGTNRYWYSVCYGNNKYIAVAYNYDENNDLIFGNDFAYIYTNNYNLISSNSTLKDTYTLISNIIDIENNSSSISGGFITYNQNKSSICGIIPIGDTVAPEKLKNAIKFDKVKFITKKYSNEYRNDQFYRYLKFTDESGIEYIAITNDLMHFTTYTITGDYAFRDGVILMHIPEKDAIAVISRHPITTDIITIDGNDPENMSDYTKPYYRLIELPFLKKYYNYSKNHVQNVKLGISTYINSDSPVVEPLTDDTLIITVFNKIYSIGIPNWTSNNLNAQNNKRFNSVFKTDSTETDATTGMQKSTIFTTYRNSNNKVIINCSTTRNGYVTNILNYDFDNPEYDKSTDKSTTIITTNMMRYQFNDITDTIEPDNVIYPVTTYKS